MDRTGRDPILAGPLGLLISERSIPEGPGDLLRPVLQHHVAAVYEIPALREAPAAAEEVSGHFDPVIQGPGPIAIVAA